MGKIIATIVALGVLALIIAIIYNNQLPTLAYSQPAAAVYSTANYVPSNYTPTLAGVENDGAEQNEQACDQYEPAYLEGVAHGFGCNYSAGTSSGSYYNNYYSAYSYPVNSYSYSSYTPPAYTYSYQTQSAQSYPAYYSYQNYSYPNQVYSNPNTSTVSGTVSSNSR